jgi:hypothetical protein
MGHRPLGGDHGFLTEDAEGLTKRAESVTLMQSLSVSFIWSRTSWRLIGVVKKLEELEHSPGKAQP